MSDASEYSLVVKSTLYLANKYILIFITFVFVIRDCLLYKQIQREVHQKTMPSIGVNLTGKSTKDVDSRTIFVSNVHFVVTKDSLSQHFNKFRDVFILTGAALGLE
ncbi:uncharacterized protein LOC110936504 [Helianthus annuus]|uniref:uncharacterized protein LOC110936504 n=1 Tax=Helianthus annuus TaxID=4232 RepID=UPI000B8FED8C|nr:uncharacterized protein LOC110936504 [Helianthus annuus]